MPAPPQQNGLSTEQTLNQQSSQIASENDTAKLIIALLNQHQYSKAKALLNQLSYLNNQSNITDIAFIDYDIDTKHFRQADEKLKQALLQHQSSAQLLTLDAQIHCKQQQFRLADQLFQQAENQSHNIMPSRTYEKSGLCELAQHHKRQAHQDFITAHNDNPNSINIIDQLALLEDQLKDYHQALTLLHNSPHFSHKTALMIQTLEDLHQSQQAEKVALTTNNL